MAKTSAKSRTAYVCTECGAEHAKWQGQCGECGAWNTLTETMVESGGAAAPSGRTGWTGQQAQIKTLAEVSVEEIPRFSTASGELDKKRQDQSMSWMWFLVNEGLERWFYNHQEIKKILPGIKESVENGRIAPTRAADELVSILGKDLLF